MKLSEYAADLLAMVQLYGDHDIVEGHGNSSGFNRVIRAPRLSSVAVRPYTPYEMAFPKTGAAARATESRTELTGEYVYVI